MTGTSINVKLAKTDERVGRARYVTFEWLRYKLTNLGVESVLISFNAEWLIWRVVRLGNELFWRRVKSGVLLITKLVKVVELIVKEVSNAKLSIDNVYKSIPVKVKVARLVDGNIIVWIGEFTTKFLRDGATIARSESTGAFKRLIL